jgi:hypothetical protein
VKNVRVILSEEAEKVYSYLNKEAAVSKVEKTILTSLNKKIKLIKQNPHIGNPVSKKLIPNEFKKKYGLTNLFRIELPNYWRMLYTLTNDDGEIEIIAFIIEVVDHKIYNKKFKYKNK